MTGISLAELALHNRCEALPGLGDTCEGDSYVSLYGQVSVNEQGDDQMAEVP